MKRHVCVLMAVLFGAGLTSGAKALAANEATGVAKNVSAKAALDVKDKKIIAFAPDRVDAAYLCQHAAEVEKPNNLPIDGLIISVYPDDWKLRKEYRNMLWFGGAKFTREDYQKTIAGLKATKFTRLTDNFLDFPTTVSNYPTLAAGGDKKFLPAPASYRFSNVDWFDADWSHVAQNGAVAAYIAREGGLKGFCIDAEGYGGGSGLWMPPFSYNCYREACSKAGVTPHTPEECLAQVRKRGREFMKAVIAVYPDITIIFIPGIGSTGDATPPCLGSAFVDGMLEGSGPSATLVDGMESGYPLQRYDSFMKLRQFVDKDNIEKSQVPELYKQRVSYGLGLWIDFECRAKGPFAGWHTDDPTKFELNYRSPARLEHSLHYALKASDRYVWLFTWHPQWLFRPEVRGKDNSAQMKDVCPLCPHGEIPLAYLDALGNCRKPHDVNWSSERMRSLEERAFSTGYSPPYATKFNERDLKRMGKNLLVNGGFETWSPLPKGGPSGWHAFGNGSVTKEEKVVKEGSSSAKMTVGKGHGYLDRSIPVGPWRGKTLLFGAWMKSDGVGILQIIDEAPGKPEETAVAECLSDGTWQFVVVRKTIQKDATDSVTFRCHGCDSTVYFDGAIAVGEKR